MEGEVVREPMVVTKVDCDGCGLPVSRHHLTRIKVGNDMVYRCPECVGKIRWAVREQFAKEKREDESRAKVKKVFTMLTKQVTSKHATAPHIQDLLSAVCKNMGGVDGVGSQMANHILKLGEEKAGSVGVVNAYLGLTKQIAHATALEQQKPDVELLSEEDLLRTMQGLLDAADAIEDVPALEADATSEESPGGV